jgi:AcrR family transcriptional regulator
MKPAPPHPPGTRERILDTAERLFAERGFAGTSVREITDAAAVNLGAVNYHFQSKENLYAEVFARRVAQLREPVAAVARESGPIARERPDEAFRAFGHVFLAPHKKRVDTLRLLGLFARETIERCLPAGFLARELRAPITEALAVIVRQVRPDMADAVARACAESFFVQLMHIVKGAGSAVGSVDEQLEHAVRFTVAAVRHIEGAPGKSARSHMQS